MLEKVIEIEQPVVQPTHPYSQMLFDPWGVL